jgi:hypothetical protein
LFANFYHQTILVLRIGVCIWLSRLSLNQGKYIFCYWLWPENSLVIIPNPRSLDHSNRKKDKSSEEVHGFFTDGVTYGFSEETK